MRVEGLFSSFFYYTILCFRPFLLTPCFPERGVYIKTKVSGRGKGAKPEAARSSEAHKNPPDDFYLHFLTSLLLFSENLEMKCGIWMKYGIYTRDLNAWENVWACVEVLAKKCVCVCAACAWKCVSRICVCELMHKHMGMVYVCKHVTVFVC